MNSLDIDIHNHLIRLICLYFRICGLTTGEVVSKLGVLHGVESGCVRPPGKGQSRQVGLDQKSGLRLQCYCPGWDGQMECFGGSRLCEELWPKEIGNWRDSGITIFHTHGKDSERLNAGNREAQKASCFSVVCLQVKKP
jgi:hypothetical protein